MLYISTILIKTTQKQKKGNEMEKKLVYRTIEISYDGRMFKFFLGETAFQVRSLAYAKSLIDSYRNN